MRRYVWSVLCLALGASAVCSLAWAQALPRTAPAQPARVDPAVRPAAVQPSPSIDPTGERMKDLLLKWAGQSTRLKTLDVSIKRTDHKRGWDPDVYTGRAMFKVPNRAWIDFQKTDPATKKNVPYDRIVCTGAEVWEYKSEDKQIFIYKLGKQGAQRTLQEGPLPFLFNFRAEEATKRYVMKLVTINASGYTVDVYPSLKIDKDYFSRARIFLDAKFLLPTRILLVDPNEKDMQDYQLSQIKPNTPVMDENFVCQPVKNWKIRVNEADEPAAGAAAKSATSPAPSARQAQQQRRGFFNRN